MKQLLSILTVIFAVILLSGQAAQAQDDWTLKSPTTQPSARYGHTMASLGGDQVLLFSENDGSDVDTWVYDLSDNTWTLKSPATKPSRRDHPAMASLGGDHVLLFGGAPFSYDDETWVYDLSDDTWTLKSPATKPSARWIHAMASLGGDQVLLFGGNDAGGYDYETWVYDLSDNIWTLKSPATKPSARWGHTMASLGGDQVLLFGGYDSGLQDDETWVYDLSDNTWTLKNPGTKPSARYVHETASLGGDQVLLFGGNDGATFDDETWVYDLSDNTWTLKSPATKPSARVLTAMASLGGDQVLLFGGWDGSHDDETWVYTATSAPTISCPANITAQNIPDQCNQSVEFSVTATGFPTPTIVCQIGEDAIASPHTFPIGITTVNCTATNVAGSANCSFTVTVQDTQPPAITCPSDMIVRPTSLAGVVAAYTTPAGTDNCSATTQQTAGLGSGSTFPIGVTANTFVATDSTGNTASCSFTVTVSDPYCAPNKVYVCHNGKTRCVSLTGMVTHLAHGDLLGPCSLGKTGEEVAEMPAQFGLEQNYPNPFNPTTVIAYALPVDARVTLEVYDILGRRVAELVNGQIAAGYHEVSFDASNLANGIYIYRLQSDAGEGKNFMQVRKLTVLK